VGRSHECDNPDWVRKLPRCSEPAFDASVSSREIDAEVGRRIRSGEPLYVIHNDLIQELKPDLIIAQEHCDVCAVTPDDVGRNCPIAPVLSLMASSLKDIFDGMVKIAKAIGFEDRGHALVQCEQRRLDAVKQRVQDRRRPSVVVLEWIEPTYAMGNWGPELVEYAGGELALGHKGELSFGMATERVRDADPEYLVIAPCGFDLKRTIAEAEALKGLGWWNELRAVREGKVALADGNWFFNRSGMTVTWTAELLAEILHGEIFQTKTEGVHWRWT
jgi:iron complex transport system substrate-binding protein